MPPKHKSTVGLARGHVRYDTVLKSLQLIEESVSERIASSMRIVIKPDFFFTGQGMSTDVDAVKAVLDFILEFTNKKITIAEGLYDGSEVQPVFHKADLHELHDDYGLKYVDLNRDGFVTIAVSKALSVRVAKTVLNSDFRVSLAVPKLASSRFSAATANIAIGSIISNGKSLKKNDKEKLSSTKYYGSAIAEVLKVVKPSFAVVDGFESVVNKKGLETNFCVSSADAVAADVVAAAALGKGLEKKIPKQKYLELCGKAGIGRSSIGKIAVVGKEL
ncbi:DUF362 domain-containing protein [Candidatus Woesearchaeota archaeon]|nr:DUF362 domain-containing protein [Candidatus Woesearchaeota archaeon]